MDPQDPKQAGLLKAIQDLLSGAAEGISPLNQVRKLEDTQVQGRHIDDLEALKKGAKDSLNKKFDTALEGQYIPFPEEFRKTSDPTPRGFNNLLPSTPGNIDLNSRPIVKNPDGSISTVKSVGVNIDGREVLLPTITDEGQEITVPEAVQRFKKTGRHLGMFSTPEEASTYAQKLHEDQAKQYLPKVK